jgi:low temperature requirement protein LtrA
LGKKNPDVQAEIDIVSQISPSLVERFALLTIIVLGEIIVGVVAGVSEHHHLTWPIGGAAALGTLVAIGIWWVYFDSVSHRLPRPGIVNISLWYYFYTCP